ncbi:MAG: hypothetical protein JW785_04435 [Acidimicrobiia bacterium]|nr:hypothetical protein [Acidimicrobiia bacterium]
MKRTSLAFVAALALLISACGGSDAADEEVVFTLTGTQGTLELTMADLQAMPATEGWGGLISSTGSITIPERLKGVSLADLAARVGGISEGMGVIITAEDGYAMTLSYDQAVSGDFITYDPSTGGEIPPPGALYPIVAYARNGEPIPGEEGPLRLWVVSDERNQIVDGHWIIKWVVAMEIKEMGEEWTLSLEGLTNEAMDRGTYDSCLNCHGEKWTDPDGVTWDGVPLWMMAARLDGGEGHGEDPYDEALAEAGYTLVLAAADGHTAEVESTLFDRNDRILLAGLLGGAALPADYFPLRLVGEGLSGSQMVAKVVAITAEIAADLTTTTAAAGAALLLSGDFAQPLNLTMAGLEALAVVELTLEHPGKGEQAYTGVRLNGLLDLAGAAAGATTLTFIASDGYEAEAPLAGVRACVDCLVAFDEEGGLRLAMPGFESGLWVKDVVEIAVG